MNKCNYNNIYCRTKQEQQNTQQHTGGQKEHDNGRRMIVKMTVTVCEQCQAAQGLLKWTSWTVCCLMETTERYISSTSLSVCDLWLWMERQTHKERKQLLLFMNEENNVVCVFSTFYCHYSLVSFILQVEWFSYLDWSKTW